MRFLRSHSRGQALILIALAFVGLAAFIGLTVDAGILFTQVGHLRRGVDSAALASANQFRQGTTVSELEDVALEFLTLNGLPNASAEVYVCDFGNPTAGNPNPNHDVNLCPPDSNSDGVYNDSPPRKFVRVVGYLPIQFTFLRVVGWNGVTLSSEAISEAASLDIVLVVDTSESMAYDAACDDAAKDGGQDDDAAIESPPDGVADDCGGSQVGAYSEDFLRDAANCNPLDECHPFEEVRAAANFLATRLNFPYDRMSVVTFDQTSSNRLQLDAGTSVGAVQAIINGLTIYDFTSCPGYPPDPTGCTSTNISDGLIDAGNELGSRGRQEAVWIVILLTDGVPNAATSGPGPIWVCPGSAGNPTWVEPFCRDDEFEVGPGSYGTDAEDKAVEAALFVGCPDSLSPQPAGCPSPGQASLIFTIGLGDQVTQSTTCDPVAYPGGCEPDAGEKLLRFIAGVGEDGDPATNPECAGVPTGQSCGNYYFSPTGANLLPVFEAIADRIFTRITH